MPRKIPSDILAKMRSRIENLHPEELHDLMDSLEIPAIDRNSEGFSTSLNTARRCVDAALGVADSLPWLEVLQITVAKPWTALEKYTSEPPVDSTTKHEQEAEPSRGDEQHSDAGENAGGSPDATTQKALKALANLMGEHEPPFGYSWKGDGRAEVTVKPRGFLDVSPWRVLKVQLQSSDYHDCLVYVGTTDPSSELSQLVVLHDTPFQSRIPVGKSTGLGVHASAFIPKPPSGSFGDQPIIVGTVDLKNSVPPDANVLGSAVAAAQNPADQSAWERWLVSKTASGQLSQSIAVEIRLIATSLREGYPKVPSDDGMSSLPSTERDDDRAKKPKD